MHDHEIEVSAALVARLVATQCPQWAGLPLRRVASAGTDNAVYRLGEALLVRLPRVDWAAEDVAKEQTWLPRLAPHLPVAVPPPLFAGGPGEGYPFPWAVYRWLPGPEATLETVRDGHEFARDLARFILALRRLPAPHGEAPLGSRGVPLRTRDDATRHAIAGCAALGLLDPDPVTAAWEGALAAPVWAGPPTWLHGDLKPGNLLAQGGRLSAVIDWSALTLGDPAADLLPAWNLLDPATRATFRAALAPDDATWARGRGWALSVGLLAWPYYRHTNPELARISQRQIQAVMSEER
ncbi:phosphotransferase [Deinococcus arcticus]|uniref:Phosphotransferase n=2 Tax=Deinococcus arcticus TaxID=2136176 RepID=A0A2T3WAF6_9DEIO|nr:phosphotransferase [Deinococcus arcticus]